MREIDLRDAAAKLSDLIGGAHREPTIITRDGQREAVIVSYEEWKRLAHVPSFGHLLMEAPLEPGDVAERQTADTMRDVLDTGIISLQASQLDCSRW